MTNEQALFEQAATTGNDKVIRDLFHRVDPKANDSNALYLAVTNGHAHIADVLYANSDVTTNAWKEGGKHHLVGEPAEFLEGLKERLGERPLMSQLGHLMGDSAWVYKHDFEERMLGKESFERAVEKATFAKLTDAQEYERSEAIELFSGTDADGQIDIIRTHPFSSKQAGELLYLAHSPEVMKELFLYGADGAVDFEHINPSGGDNWVQHTDDLIESYEIYRLFNEAGALGDNGGWYLREAAKKNQMDIVEGLYNEGVDLNSTSSYDKKTALFEAWTPEMTRFLIEHGADVDAQDNIGNTPLFDNHKTEAVMTELINGGADLNHVNKYGQTCRQYNGDDFSRKLDSVVASVEKERLQENLPQVEATVQSKPKRGLRL